VNHFYRSVLDALEFDGPAIVVCYTTCQPEHGVADNMATDQARLAVDSRAFPLLIYDPRKGHSIKSRLSLQGNPAVNDDWWLNPKTGQQVDFIDFARSEGRFSKHFDKDGNPSETLLYAKQDRLENWHVLQELAGVLDKKKPAAKGAAKPAESPKAAGAAKAMAAKAMPANGKTATSATEGNRTAAPRLSPGAKIKYHDGSRWVAGVLESTDPAVLSFEDETEIRTTPKVLADALKDGLITLQ
jgi:hypothetical protein